MSSRGASPTASSAAISPMTLANLKPWPEPPPATTTCVVLGMEVEQEVLVGRVLEQARLQRHRRPGPSGK